MRIDSEHVQRDYLENIKLIRSYPSGWRRLSEFALELTGGATPLGAEYPETGVPFLRVQNIMPNFIDDSNMGFITQADDAILARSRLKLNDVLFTITGVSYGKAAVVSPDFVGANINQHSVRIAVTTGIRPHFLATFLNASPGKLQSDQNITGVTRPALDYPTIRSFSLPLCSDLFQEAVEKAVISGLEHFQKAKYHRNQADQMLLRALGLEDWRPPEPLTYIRTAADAFSSNRFDAEYFAPRVEELLDRLKADGLTISDVAPVRHEVFIPTKENAEFFEYIEIGGMRNDGTATNETVPCDEAPSRASQRVRKNDIVTSTVRPIRRLSAIITADQDGHVCSSGFLVLQPTTIAPEVLLTYLRLPVICELMDLHTSASLYPAISERDLLKLPIPKIDKVTTQSVVNCIRAAHTARHEARELLERAKRAVEIAIEQDEKAAIRFLNLR